jgi:flavin reductase (DIM6/NTAB) family NADH-FMN oxidoreductase RutF
MTFLRPDDLAPRLRYNLLIGAVVPRPIAVVGTIAPHGAFNLAPFSFFNAFSAEPMIVGFAPANGPTGGEKDSLRNAKPRWEGGTGCFTVSVATEPILRRVVAAAEELPYGTSEFELVGLTPAAGTAVAAPHVAESPIAFECETIQLVRFAPGVPGAGNLVLGRVLGIHLAEELRHERMHVDPDRLRAVGRMGGTAYASTRERIELPMGLGAIEVREAPFPARPAETRMAP